MPESKLPPVTTDENTSLDPERRSDLLDRMAREAEADGLYDLLDEPPSSMR